MIGYLLCDVSGLGVCMVELLVSKVMFVLWFLFMFEYFLWVLRELEEGGLIIVEGCFIYIVLVEWLGVYL